MYESFFGLKREPFSVAPDPRFLYMSDKHREALAYLMYGLRRGGGFVLLTGEIGAGKTTVYRHFLEQLPPNVDVAYVANPKLGVNALLTRVSEDLRVEPPANGIVNDPIDAIQGHLLLAHARGRRALIVVDEAQALSIDVLEQLRLLTNLVTNDRKLLQMLLIGQPELRTMLEQPALEPVAQRVVARFHLPALSEAETARYVAHRLSVAGLEGDLPFDAAALARIHKLCGGVPRRINVLCDRSLFGAHAAGSRRIDPRFIDQAATEVFGRAPAAPPAPALGLAPGSIWPRWLAFGGVAGCALAAGLVLAPRLAPTLGSLSRAAPPPATAVAAVDSKAPADAAAPTPALTSTSPLAPVAVPAAAPAATSTVAAVMPVPAASAAEPAKAGALDLAFSAATANEAPAWRALAGLWGATLASGEPCAAALQQSLHCFGGLGPIRELGRPVILKLADDRARVAYLLLTGLAGDNATLRADGAEFTLPLVQLARVWRGEFATLWRAPPGYREGELVGASGPSSPWLVQRLTVIDGAASAPTSDDALKAQVFAFQLAHGLEPDGLAGPLTLMQLNRASGIDEPRLQSRR
jgi:general secretion pathway protein A